jgi:hypothetical protein
VTKRDPRLRRVLDRVAAAFDDGRATSLADDEVAVMVDAAFAPVDAAS